MPADVRGLPRGGALLLIVRGTASPPLVVGVAKHHQARDCESERGQALALALPREQRSKYRKGSKHQQLGVGLRHAGT